MAHNSICHVLLPTTTKYMHEPTDHYRCFRLSDLLTSNDQPIDHPLLSATIIIFSYAQEDDLAGVLACRNLLNLVQNYFRQSITLLSQSDETNVTSLFQGAIQLAYQSILNFSRSLSTPFANKISSSIIVYSPTPITCENEGSIRQLTSQIVASNIGNCEVQIFSNVGKLEVGPKTNQVRSQTHTSLTILAVVTGKEFDPKVRVGLLKRLPGFEIPKEKTITAALLIEPITLKNRLGSIINTKNQSFGYIGNFVPNLAKALIAIALFVSISTYRVAIMEFLRTEYTGVQLWVETMLSTTSLTSEFPVIRTPTSASAQSETPTLQNVPSSVPERASNPTSAIAPTFTPRVSGANSNPAQSIEDSVITTITNTPLPQAQTTNTVSTPTTSSQPGQVNATATVASPSPTSPPSPSPEPATPLPMRPGSTVPNR